MTQHSAPVGDREIDAEASRAETIARILRDQILARKYEPGERLPSERELAIRHGGSRNSAREALKRLEHEGMIAIRRGGARVVPIEEAGLHALQHVLTSSGLPPLELVSQWLDVRELVLAGAARFSVERASPQELAKLKQLVKRLERPEASLEQISATVDDLIELISIASRNVVLRMVIEALAARRARRGKRRSLAPAGRRALAQMARAVERALDDRDADAVETSVRTLLRALGRSYLDHLAQERSRGQAPPHA